jgi:hypothetical protein
MKTSGSVEEVRFRVYEVSSYFEEENHENRLKKEEMKEQRSNEFEVERD